MDPNVCNESDGRIAQKDSHPSESSGKADLTISCDLLVARTDFTAPVQLRDSPIRKIKLSDVDYQN